MLKEWQEKFPGSFAKFPDLVKVLTVAKQTELARFFDELEKTGLDLLNEHSISQLLDSFYYIKELQYLIGVATTLKCFNKTFFTHLLNHLNISSLKDNVENLSRVIPLSEEIVTLLLFTEDSANIVFLLQSTHAMGIELPFMLAFIAKEIKVEGLHDALTLFNLSGLDYSSANLALLSMLTTLFANPLSRTIFAARLRGFCMMAEKKEPLTAETAHDIISKCFSAKAEDRVSVFFDYLINFRSNACSQLDLVEINVSQLVAQALKTYCKQVIGAIESQDDYLQAKKLIETLITTGGDDSHFEKIKYDVAEIIESTDLFSTRNYEQLMDEIKAALTRPQRTLNRPIVLRDFTETLKESKGYKESKLTISEEPFRVAVVSIAALLDSSGSLLGKKRKGGDIEGNRNKKGRLDTTSDDEVDDFEGSDGEYDDAYCATSCPS